MNRNLKGAHLEKEDFRISFGNVALVAYILAHFNVFQYTPSHVRPVAEDEIMFRVISKGIKTKQLKRMIKKATIVGPSFTRNPPKYERFIRPTGLRFTKAHVTHPELKCTFNLEIIGVNKNPNSPMYTIIEVSIYAQVTNNPENDGCINAVLIL